MVSLTDDAEIIQLGIFLVDDGPGRIGADGAAVPQLVGHIADIRFQFRYFYQ